MPCKTGHWQTPAPARSEAVSAAAPPEPGGEGFRIPHCKTYARHLGGLYAAASRAGAVRLFCNQPCGKAFTGIPVDNNIQMTIVGAEEQSMNRNILRNQWIM